MNTPAHGIAVLVGLPQCQAAAVARHNRSTFPRHCALVATSDAVALAFFPTATGVSVASGANFPDALAAGPVAGTATQPVLLVPATGALPEPIATYLTFLSRNLLFAIPGILGAEPRYGQSQMSLLRGRLTCA